MHRECVPLNRDEYHKLKDYGESLWMCTICSAEMFPFNHITEDDEFLNELSDYYNELPKFHQDINDERIFNVLDMNNNNFLPLFSCDPDLNFYNDYTRNILTDSKYYSIDSFQEVYKSTFSDEQVLSLCHLNIRSMPAHL